MSRSLKLALLAVTATTSLAAPALAQSAADEQRFQAAQQRFDREYQIFRQEIDRYQAARTRGYGGRYDQGYAPRDGYDDGDRYENGYDPARYYRQGDYQERTLRPDERVYAGDDGRYYCKRSDGTTGLVVGGAAGGILGNVIDGGHSRIVGTLLGGAAGALAGRAIDQNNSQIRCR